MGMCAERPDYHAVDVRFSVSAGRKRGTTLCFQFYIVEIKQYPNGEYEHDAQWAYDENQDFAQRKAESKAYDLLKDAALSNTVTHSIMVLSDEGFLVLSKCYHNVTTAE